MEKRNGDISLLIDKGYEAHAPKPYESKGSIGASAIGNECDALLSLSLRGFPDDTPRPKMRRIFRDGHRIEDAVLGDLKMAGLYVMSNDPLTGKQWKWTGYGGLAVYKSDGILEMSGETSLIEIKSMNDALWNKFRTYGLRISHPYYYDQVQMGMGLSGIKGAYLIAYNKDKSLYWDEFIEFDPARWHYLASKIERSMDASTIERCSTDSEDWRCKSCFKRGVCWGGVAAKPGIRTCKNSWAKKDGTFVCKNGCTTECKSFEQWMPKDRT